MVMQCFVLDLRSLSPPLLRDLKQSLLQLSNFYAISAPINGKPQSKALTDRIGLCYILKNQTSGDELKVAYCPRGNFSLRDFHHAINNLPTDAFLPEFNNSGALCCSDTKLSSILSDQVLYSWEGHEKDIVRKLIMISSSLVKIPDSVTRNILMDAADKCILVDFVFLEQNSSYLGYVPEKINNFAKKICDLENCSFQTYFPDAQILNGLVKRWLQELQDDMEEPLQARFVFKSPLLGSLNHISCNLCASVKHIIDGFTACQACRCHGFPLDDANVKKMNRPSCRVTGDNLGNCDLVKNSVKVGTQTILFMPSSQCCMKLQKVSSPIDLSVLERTNLGSLSEGVILGTSYIVTPSNSHESDDIDKSEQNTQLFQVLCSSLHSLDQGLVCSSYCNIETVSETSFQCYYILLPSERGLMLLRRLAGSEEVFPLPDVSQLNDSTATKKIKNSVVACLHKMDASDYNPVLHERGFHQKLNLLVKESLQFGSMPLKLKEVISEPNSTLEDSSGEVVLSNQADVVDIEEETPDLDLKTGEDKATARIAEEWEQLIVTEEPKKFSPTCISKPKLDQPIVSPLDHNRQVDEKTSRILERLEVPRQLKIKTASPVITSGTTADACALTKKPLIPLNPVLASDQGTTGSQPMKPNFQRLKRKQR